MTQDQIQHVYPVNDSEPHILECERLNTEHLPYCACPCRPTHKEVGNEIQGVYAMIIVHNSFDGREGVEWANEILKPKECLCDAKCDRFIEGGRKCYLDKDAQ